VALAACVFALGVAGRAEAQRHPPPVGVGRAIGQGAAGFLGTPIGFVGGGLATRWVSTHWFGASEDRASAIAMWGAYAGGALVTAAGPTLVGPGPHATGTYWGALAGSTAGGLGSFLLIRLNRAVDLGSVARLVGTVAVFTLPAVGATIGYDATRRWH